MTVKHSRDVLLMRLRKFGHHELSVDRNEALRQAVVQGFFWCGTSKSSVWTIEVQAEDFILGFLTARISASGAQTCFEQMLQRLLEKTGHDEEAETGHIPTIACRYGFEPDERWWSDEDDEKRECRLRCEVALLEILWREAGKYYQDALAQATEAFYARPQPKRRNK